MPEGVRVLTTLTRRWATVKYQDDDQRFTFLVFDGDQVGIGAEVRPDLLVYVPRRAA